MSSITIEKYIRKINIFKKNQFFFLKTFGGNRNSEKRLKHGVFISIQIDKCKIKN